MNHAYIVTESNSSTLVLQQLLPKHIMSNIKFVSCTNYDSAQNIAGNLLLIKQRPVALILDADSIDPETISDRRVMNEELLRFSAVAPFQVILAVPEIEILLFQDREVVEELFDQEISDVDWVRAEFIPRTILQKLLTQNSHPDTLEQLLDRLTPPMIAKLRNHPLLQEVTEFLAQVSDTQLVPV